MTKKTVTTAALASLFISVVLLGCGGLSEAERHYNAGVDLQEQGRLDEAIAEYSEAVRLNPRLVEAYYNRGVAYTDLGQFQRAVQDFDEAISLDPQFVDAYVNRSRARGELGQYQQVIQDCDEAISLDPQSAEAYYNRGLAYCHLEQFQQAIQDFDEAISLDPQSAEAYMNRGNAYRGLDQYEQAIEDYDEAIRLNPQGADAYYNRGNAYCLLGKFQHGIDDFDKAIQLNPQDAESFRNRGLAYYELGEYQRAVEDYTEYIRFNPGDAEGYVCRTLAYCALGEDEQASSDFDRAVGLGFDPYLLKEWVDEVKELRPSAYFYASPTGGAPPLTVQFTDNSSGDITEWAWDFDNDGTVDSTQQNPSHTYDTTGTYAVSLTVKEPGGSKDTQTWVDCITVAYASPFAAFTSSRTNGAAPLEVQLTDQSDGDITQWMWQFGDGQTSTEQNPSHTYTNPGIYTVSLTVSNPDGSDTETKAGYIRVVYGVELGGVGFDMEVDPLRQQFYVSVPSLDEVVIVSMSPIEIVDRISFAGQSPHGLDLSLDGATLYVALNQAALVAAVDLETMDVTEIDVGIEVGNSLIYDVIEGKPNRLYVSANPGAYGFAYLALVKLDENNSVSRITSGGIIRARPVLLASSDMNFLYVGEGFTPNSLYKFDMTTDDPAKVLEDEHGSISGTDRFDLSLDGTRIYLRSGQVLSTDSFLQIDYVTPGVPKVNADGSLLYVGYSDDQGGTIEVYDSAQLTKVDELAISCAVDRIELFPDGSGLLVLGGDLVCCVP